MSYLSEQIILMPHQCVRCGKMYPDGSQEILKGCECTGRFFLYVNENNLHKAEELRSNLTEEDKTKIEVDIRDIIGKNVDDDQPIILDIESIRVPEVGKYELDLVHMFKREPIVYKMSEGKYLIDLSASFNLRQKK